MVQDVRIDEIVHLAAEGFRIEIGRCVDAGEWGYDFFSVELVPQEAGRSRFHIRIPFNYLDEPLAAIRYARAQIGVCLGSLAA